VGCRTHLLQGRRAVEKGRKGELWRKEGKGSCGEREGKLRGKGGSR